MEMVILSPEALSQLVTEAVRRAIPNNNQAKEQLPDRMRLPEVTQETGLSESSIYKLTMEKKIPFSKFGKQLVFSRKEIRQWVEANTINKDAKSEAGVRLAKQVGKKKGAAK